MNSGDISLVMVIFPSYDDASIDYGDDFGIEHGYYVDEYWHRIV